MRACFAIGACIAWSARVVSPALAQESFVNFETPHVHPLELAPGNALLLAVNTPDARLEVFDASGRELAHKVSIPVGLDPVSVRARSEREAWVVNHVSDSVSIVDLREQNVVATLATDDEPCDVVFAGTPPRAFVSCSQANTILVFDLAHLDRAPARVAIDGEDPRALAVSADGTRVYCAIFESGNGSTILGGGLTLAGGYPPNVVSHLAGPYAGTNPPPNRGASFEPPLNPANPPPPAVGLIVKQDNHSRWMDDNGGDWSDFVGGTSAALSGRAPGWELLDHDVAVIDTTSLSVAYFDRLMNACMAIAVKPDTGDVTVVGTDATNEVRFEPVLRGRFLRVELAIVDPAGASRVLDLNPHLDYSVPTVPPSVRELSLGDPRGIAWEKDGSRAWITGQGSDHVIAIDAKGRRMGRPIPVGAGPTGVALDESRERVYVLDRFDGALSVVSTRARAESQRVAFFDPTPDAVKKGRRHFYDTHATSGLGLVACASCHVDARTDRLAWDLGDPRGTMQPFGPNCGFGVCQPFHPMKGPMLTQTLQDVVGNEPLHWRGDRRGLEAFNGAFTSLQAAGSGLDAVEMQEFEDFLASIHLPPNPYRTFENGLPERLALPEHYTTGRFAPAGLPLPDGDATRGLALFRPPELLDGVACATCHTLPTGLGSDALFDGATFVPIPPGPDGEHHHALVALDGSTNAVIKVPQLRTLHERTGFDAARASRAGFGYRHDGSVDTLERFVTSPNFHPASDQDVADLVAFLLAFSGSDLPSGGTSNPLEPPGTASRDAHAAVGRQLTLAAAPLASDREWIATAMQLAEARAIGLVVKGRFRGSARGFTYVGGGRFQPDRSEHTIAAGELTDSAARGSELTWTLVPSGTEFRMGIDRDADGVLDGDECFADTR